MSEEPLQRAWRFFREGRLDESRRIADRLLELNPADPQVRLLDGLICARQGRLDEAEASLTASLHAQRSYSVLLSLGELYLLMGEPVKAEQFLLEAIEQQPEAERARTTLANVYAHQGRHEQAVEYYRWTVDKGLADAGVFGNMALSLEMLRKHDEARHAAQESLKRDANCPAAHLVLARLDRVSRNVGDSLSRLQQAIAYHQNTIEGANLLSEFGHALDLSGDYGKAFEAFDRANRIWQAVAQRAPFGKELYLQRIEDFQELLVLPARELAEDDFGAHLVFFVGFPRSGTTLVEQVLKTLPDIATTQEEPLITNLAVQLTGGNCNAGAYPALLDRLSGRDMEKLRNLYIGELLRVTESDGTQTLYIDKLPLNIIETVFIHRLFPAARFLVAQRDPRDVCLSCFMQSFRLNPAMIHFLDLKDTANFYAATMALWNRCKEVLVDLRYLEYRYEDLVTDFDTVSKRILAFVGAEWTPDVREFHRQAGERVIRTPSFIDVASPLYTRAVARWKHYEDQLRPVSGILGPFVEQFGYTVRCGCDGQ